jgi:Membrane bound O-acyl transferase family
MDLTPLTPLVCYVVASLFTIVSLRLRKRNRVLSLGPICLFSFLSLTSVHKLSWPIGANSTFASLVVFYLPYAIKILALDEHAVSPESSTHSWSFIDCYRVWNNPRNLPVRLSLLDRSAPCDLRSRAVFVRNQIMKAAALWAFDRFVFQKVLIQAFSHIVAADFSPDMEQPTMRLVLHLSFYQLQVRTIVSVQWIWSAFFFLEFYHCLLGIVFVAIGFDQPEEWPPLYGNPLSATSIRSFWGRFWHRLTIPTYSYYSKLISQKLLGLRPGSRAEKTIIPMLIFTMSGVSHCLAGWSLGDAALSRDVLFFLFNFFAAAVETGIFKAKAAIALKGPFHQLPGSFHKFAGFAWILTFFFCVTPMWMYPKVHHALVGIIH